MLFLPMIDMDPGNLTCIFSTLQFICNHARQYNVKPMITFDQPLWLKSLEVIESQPDGSEFHDIILQLGGFHTLMSFLGCIGHIMAGSGLQYLLEQVYAGTTVKHMLTGKAYSRAVRGHLLVAAALHTMITAMALNIPLPHESPSTHEGQLLPQSKEVLPSRQLGTAAESYEPAGEILGEESSRQHPVPDIDQQPATSAYGETADLRVVMTSDTTSIPGLASLESTNLEHDDKSQAIDSSVMTDLKELGTLYEDPMSGNTPKSSAGTSPALHRISGMIETMKQSLRGSRNSKLWLQYLDMVNILCRFLRSERTGNWKLHLQVLQEMVPYLAAAGHNSYTKSLLLYLHRMSHLDPDVSQIFENGLHVVRRSDRYWAGLSSDLVIEQVLMRSLKTTGGLTRGRGFDELQRLIWLLSRPVCAEINLAMQEFTSVSFTTSEQHKDISSARQERDVQDTNKLITVISSRTPFSSNSPLHSLDTGVCAEESVNADQALAVGEQILNTMYGCNVLDYVFKKKNQVITMEKKVEVSLGGVKIDIDPQLLFQRLVTAGVNSGELKEVFQYELCSYPPALFESQHAMLKADKAALANNIWKALPMKDPELPAQVTYVLDGGSLLHRVPWDAGKTWAAICNSYTRYVHNKYGCAYIVFDGYNSGPTTKDATHGRRANVRIAPTVQFTSDMVCTLKKEEFLSNTVNKQRFINMLASELEQYGCTVQHAAADADVLIVQTTLAQATQQDTVLIGDDMDLLVLLCSKANNPTFKVFFKSEPRSGSRKPARCWDIVQTQQFLGNNVCEHLLFVHALSGCDTTSRLYGMGKPKALKKAASSEYLRQQAAVFKSASSQQSDIIRVGENALVCLYRGQAGETLDMLRFQLFHQKVSSNTESVQPRTLPPTSAAAQYHSLRVFHQVQQWQGVDLLAEDWGWMVKESKLCAFTTNLPPAPLYLLEAIHCGCKSGCASRRCGCRKYGLECSLACSECKGMLCSNTTGYDGDDYL